MNRPSTLPMIVIAGALAGAFVGWMIKTASILIADGYGDTSTFAVIAGQLRSSPVERFEFIALMVGFVLLGAFAAYGVALHHRYMSQQTIVGTAREADRAKNVFISMLLHFIRTPLAGIRWSLDSLRDRPDVGIAGKHQLNMLYDETLRALDAVEHLLDVSRASVGNIPYTFETMPAAEGIAAVDHAVEEVRPQAEQKNIALSITHNPLSDGHRLKIDRSKIQVAAQTLLENAINYTPVGGKITVETKEAEGGFQCSVTDTGIGIPKKDQGKIFMQFYRSENARRNRPAGFGVGLYMIKIFIEKHGGEVWFESQEGAGTTFFFHLPYAETAVEKKKATLPSPLKSLGEKQVPQTQGA